MDRMYDGVLKMNLDLKISNCKITMSNQCRPGFLKEADRGWIIGSDSGFLTLKLLYMAPW